MLDRRLADQPLELDLGVKRPEGIGEEDVRDQGRAREEQGDEDAERTKLTPEPLPLRPADESNGGKEEHPRDLRVIAEPEAHGGHDPETASPRRVLLREGAEHAEDREAREEREHDVVGDHRRPR